MLLYCYENSWQDAEAEEWSHPLSCTLFVGRGGRGGGRRCPLPPGPPPRLGDRERVLYTHRETKPTACIIQIKTSQHFGTANHMYIHIAYTLSSRRRCNDAINDQSEVEGL